MAIRESLLRAIQALNLNDFVRVVTANGESRNVSVPHLAKTIVEDYKLESLAGGNQSVAAAVDSISESLGTVETELSEKADASALEIDSEVIDLYESLGWVPPNETRMMSASANEEEEGGE